MVDAKRRITPPKNGRLVGLDKLEIETKKAQLEAAKWPRFSDIAA
jgi:hypothetical protein